jgi:membrane protein required for colicin V production
MHLFDIILLAIIAGFGLFGFWFGLISTIGSIAGTAAGVFMAGRFYVYPAAMLMKFTHWTGNFSNVVGFIIVFLVVNRLVGLAFYLLDRFLFIITRIPFIGGLNRLLGLVFGLAEGVLVLGVTFFIIQRFPLWPLFMSQVAFSKVVPVCVEVTSFLWPLLPGVLKV